MPVLAGDARVRDCLYALHEQTLPAETFTTILVENGGERASLAGLLPADRPHWQHLFLPAPGSYAARNAGVAATNAVFLAFTDADCVPASDWLEQALHRLETQPATVFGGRITLQTSAQFNPVEHYDALTALDQERIIHERRYAVTANLIVSRSVFEKVGPFAAVQSSGDYEWGNRAVRLGVPLSYAPELTVAHAARKTLAELYERNVRIAAGLVSLRGAGTARSKKSWVGKHAFMLLGQSLKILRAKHLTVWQKLQVLTVWKFAVFASAVGALGKRG